MAKYEKRKRSGWVFYHENSAVFEAMEPAECKAAILALNKYSRQLSDENVDIDLDVSNVPTPMGQAFCKMIAERIHQDAVSYFQRCEKNAANRKSQQSTTVDAGERPSTTVDAGRPINKTKHRETKHEEVEEVSTSSADEEDRIRSLICRYNIPDGEENRKALLEDAEKHGFDKLEDALKRASLSNSRQMLSVAFYRAVLNGTGRAEDSWDNCPRF